MSRGGLLAGLLAAALSAGFAAAAEPGVTLEPGRSAYPIARAQVLIDPAKELSIEGLRALEAKGAAAWASAERFNFGYSSARFWLKVSVENRSDEDDWLLEFGYPMIQVLHFHQFTAGKPVLSHKTGKLLPFASRPIAYHDFLFEFSVPKGGRTELYVMVESVGAVVAPMAIVTRQVLLSKGAQKTTGIGIYCGIVLAMVFYNFFLFLNLRDRNYLYYVAYALSFGLLLFTLNGMSYQYLWPDWTAWNKVSVPVLVGASYLFLSLFTKSFLETKKHARRWDHGLTLLLAGSVFLILCGFLRYGPFVNHMTSLFISVAPLIVLPISGMCLWAGSPVAAYYLAAFGCFFAGSAAHAARDLGWLSQGFFTQNGPYLGSAAEVILLSLGLAARMRLLTLGKLKASQVAHDIRSPLAALDVALREGASAPEGQRAVLQGAVSRLHDIAGDLEGGRGASEGPSAHDLRALVLPLLEEKRLEFRAKAGVRLEDLAGGAGLRARVQPAEFKRLLSNLINNAVEALGGSGTVSLRLGARDGWAELEVRDTGKGIAPEVLARLGRRGETHGKAGGSGLGLHHARTALEGWGGSLELSSEVGRGTAALVRLPPAGGPDAVLLDDDALVHAVWKLSAKNHGKTLLVFSDPEALMKAAATLDKATPIYLDSHLQDDVKGEEVAKRLYAQGFSQLRLCTGQSADSFGPMPWLKAVRGKDAPWR